MEVESNDFWETGEGKLRLLGDWRWKIKTSGRVEGRERTVGRFEGESKECRWGDKILHGEGRGRERIAGTGEEKESLGESRMERKDCWER